MTDKIESPYEDLLETRVLVFMEYHAGKCDYRQILFTADQSSKVMRFIESMLVHKDKEKFIVPLSETTLMMPNHLKTAYTPEEIAGDI